jgi:hypothetical protein
VSNRVWKVTIDLVDLDLDLRDPAGLHYKYMTTEVAADASQRKILKFEFEHAIDAILRLDRKMTVGEE